MSVKIHIHDTVQHRLESINHEVVDRIRTKLTEMVDNEFRDLRDYDVERVKKCPADIRRTRIGDWRVFFQLRNRGRDVAVLGVSHRETAYGSLDQLQTRADDFSDSLSPECK